MIFPFWPFFGISCIQRTELSPVIVYLTYLSLTTITSGKIYSCGYHKQLTLVYWKEALIIYIYIFKKGYKEKKQETRKYWHTLKILQDSGYKYKTKFSCVMMSPAQTMWCIQPLLHQTLSWYFSIHHRNFGLRPQAMRVREKLRELWGETGSENKIMLKVVLRS